ALELGRAMVLHAASVDASIPTLLRDSGHDQLARRWEEESAKAADPDEQPWDAAPDARERVPSERSAAALLANLSQAQLPSDLRYHVLEALEETEAKARLLSPPSITDIAEALRAKDTTALAYLIPREGRTHGVAVVVTADGRVQQACLPRLDCAPGSPVHAFDQRQRELVRAESDPAER